jgi:hypothetical protein
MGDICLMYRSDDEWVKNTLSLLRATQNCQFATSLLSCKYFMTYHDKHARRTPFQSGHGWTKEKLSSPGESYKQFRMNTHLFYMLHDLLVDKYGLQSSIHMNSMESLAIFFLCVAKLCPIDA